MVSIVLKPTKENTIPRNKYQKGVIDEMKGVLWVKELYGLQDDKAYKYQIPNASTLYTKPK